MLAGFWKAEPPVGACLPQAGNPKAEKNVPKLNARVLAFDTIKSSDSPLLAGGLRADSVRTPEHVKCRQPQKYTHRAAKKHESCRTKDRRKRSERKSGSYQSDNIIGSHMENSAERNEMETHDEGDRWRHEIFLSDIKAQRNCESDQDGLCDADVKEANHHPASFSTLTVISELKFRSLEARSASQAKSEPHDRTASAVHDNREESRQHPSDIPKLWAEAISDPERPGDCENDYSV
jgi:hypothetical protein